MKLSIVQTNDASYKLFSKEDSIEKAAQMNQVEFDDWTYKPSHCPQGTGLSFIEIFDEDGENVGRL